MGRFVFIYLSLSICLYDRNIPLTSFFPYRLESNHTSSRAARSIAGIHYTLNEFSASIPFFEAALSINPLYSRSWFVLGCAYVKEENWNEAVKSFRRVVAIEEEDAEGWANLASCYLRMGDIGGLVRLLFLMFGEGESV